MLTAGGLLSWADAPDYFPLQVGNQWIYRSSTGNQIRQIEVTGQQDLESGTYYTVTNFAGPSALLRRVGDQLFKFDTDTHQDVLLEAFGAPAGQGFPTALDSCTSKGTVADSNGNYSGPIGTVDSNVFVVTYSGACADGGIQEDRFIAYVGMVSRIEQSIAGPRKFDLVYSNTGGVTSVTAPHVSFSLNLDQGTYQAGAAFLAQLTFRNTTAEPIQLEWSSQQRFDLQIFDTTGVEVYRWSNGIVFAQVASNESFQGERNWVVPATLQANDKSRLPAGRYVMQGYLTTGSRLAKAYSASVGFEIR